MPSSSLGFGPAQLASFSVAECGVELDDEKPALTAARGQPTIVGVGTVNLCRITRKKDHGRVDHFPSLDTLSESPLGPDVTFAWDRRVLNQPDDLAGLLVRLGKLLQLRSLDLVLADNCNPAVG